MSTTLFENRQIRFTRSQWPKTQPAFPRHTHHSQDKIIWVESGSLEVRVWSDPHSEPTTHILQSGDTLFVARGQFRQLKVLEDTVFFKVYWR